MSVWFDKSSKCYRIRIQRNGREVAQILPKGITRKQADEKHTQIMRELFDLELGKKPDLPISEAIFKYVNEVVPELKSARKTESHLNNIFEMCEGKKLSELEQVAKDYKEKNKGILAPQTINNRLAQLRRIGNLAFKKWKLIDKPVHIEISEAKNQRHLYLTLSEFWNLYDATDSQSTKDAMKIAVFTGLRQGNILDPNIRKYIKFDVIALPDTKNGEPHIVPILEEIKDEVARLPIAVSARTIQHHFKKAANKIGMPDLRFHDLRHTTASLLINAGHDLKMVGEVLGHKSLKSANRYSHLALETKRAALRKVFGA